MCIAYQIEEKAPSTAEFSVGCIPRRRDGPFEDIRNRSGHVVWKAGPKRLKQRVIRCPCSERRQFLAGRLQSCRRRKMFQCCKLLQTMLRLQQIHQSIQPILVGIPNPCQPKAPNRSRFGHPCIRLTHSFDRKFLHQACKLIRC